MWIELKKWIPDKTRNRPVSFVTLKRFAVLLRKLTTLRETIYSQLSLRRTLLGSAQSAALHSTLS